MAQRSFMAAFLMIQLGRAEALEEGKICYILDGILVVYGIILTVLYIRLKMHPALKKNSSYQTYPEKLPYEGGIYSGLTHPGTDTYETIHIEKKTIV